MDIWQKVPLRFIVTQKIQVSVGLHSVVDLMQTILAMPFNGFQAIDRTVAMNWNWFQVSRLANMDLMS